MTKLVRAAVPLLSMLGVFLLLYEGLRGICILSPQLTPGTGTTIRALALLLCHAQFWGDIAITSYRAVLGVLVGGLVGLPVGFVMGIHSWTRRGLLPIVDFLRALPAVALFPALATMLGLGEATKLTLIGIPSGLMISIFAYYACAEVRSALLEYLTLLKVSRADTIRHVFIPSVATRFPACFRYTLPLALVLSVIADMFVGARHGLGVRLVEYQETFQLPKLYATILTTGALGFLMNWIADKLSDAVEKRGLVERWSR